MSIVDWSHYLEPLPIHMLLLLSYEEDIEVKDIGVPLHLEN